jgi:DNA repair exonuclease SbcCD ATPase subunit
MTLEREIDSLYALAPGDFVAARRDLANRLRAEGRRAESARAGELRKPTVAAWAVNLLARSEKARMRALLGAGDRLRRAHERVLAGGEVEALQEATEAERQVVRELTSAAERLLAEAGHPANEPTLDRVAKTLHAAAVDPDLRERVRQGRLEKETEASGFGFSGPGPAAVAPARRAPSRERVGRQSEERLRAATERLEEAEGRLEEAKEGVRTAREEAAEAEREAKRTARELERRRTEVKSLEREVERAEAAVRKLRGRPRSRQSTR